MKTIIELKNAILNNKLSDEFLVLVCPENYFIADQYVNEICSRKHLDKKHITSLSELNSGISALVIVNNNLNILKVDEFNEGNLDYSQFENTIVVCHKLGDKVKNNQELASYVVEIPKLIDWQIKDYIKVLCPVLDDHDIDWLYKVCNGDIYRITNELDKILVFDDREKQSILNKLKAETPSDLFTFGIFDITNAVISCNYQVLYNYLQQKKYFDLAPLSLVNLLLPSYKLALLLKFNGKTTAADLGINDSRAGAIKRQFSGFSEEQLKYNISFLSSIDLKLKSGLVDFQNDSLFIDYLLCNLI